MKITMYTVLMLLVSVNLFSQDKIVGGDEVKNFKEASYLVSYGGCGASIINDKWLLTAAHCKSIFTRDMFAGSLSSSDKILKLKMDEAFIHPQYGTSGLSFDFALIRLTETIDLKKYNITPIKLATKRYANRGFQKPGTVATVYGWGRMTEGGAGSTMLRKVDVPVVSNEVANEPGSYDGRVSESMIAAGLAEGGKDACQGDSGGPMVTTGPKGRKYLVGVVSWGVGCARALKYGVYSKVSAVEEWINETIELNTL